MHTELWELLELLKAQLISMCFDGFLKIIYLNIYDNYFNSQIYSSFIHSYSEKMT